MSRQNTQSKIMGIPVSASIANGVRNQKAVLGLSILSVLLTSVFLNEWLVKSQLGAEVSAGLNRGVASFEEGTSVEGIQWEHELAQKLSEDKSSAKSFLAAKPTLKDELIFGFLEGKYRTQLSDNKIQGFEFSEGRTSDQPLVIKEKAEFLKSFKNVFAVSYSKVELERKEPGIEVYKLIGSTNQTLGTARFNLDDQGRVLSLKIQ